MLGCYSNVKNMLVFDQYVCLGLNVNFYLDFEGGMCLRDRRKAYVKDRKREKMLRTEGGGREKHAA